MSMDQEKNSSEFRNSALLAIMQNVSMSVGPEDELRRLHAENEILRAGYDAARLEIDSLQAANLELERLCEATYVAQGADAYHHACEEMERHQALRAKDGKEVGTTQSLCDGMSWLYGHIAALEAQMVAVGAGGVEPLRKRECLHQISEPGQPVAVERIGTMFFPSSPEHSMLGIFLSAMSDQLKIDGPAMRDAMLWYCGVQEIASAPQVQTLLAKEQAARKTAQQQLEECKTELTKLEKYRAVPRNPYLLGRAGREPLTAEQLSKELMALIGRLFDARIGQACSSCEAGTYQADSNGYSQFHRCNKCHYVPIWGEDGREFGIPAAKKGGQHAD